MAYYEHEITVMAQLKKKKKTTLVYSVTLFVNEGFYKKIFLQLQSYIFHKSRFFKVEKLSFPPKKKQKDLSEK